MERIRSLLSVDDREKLVEHYPDEEVTVWGLTPGARGQGKTKWEQISPGDVALFSWQNKFRSCARVTGKTDNPELARKLWGTDDEGNTWRYVYFLTKARECDVPYEVLNEAVGFKRNYVPQGFNILDEEKSRAVLKTLDLPVERGNSSWPTTWWVNQGRTYTTHRDLGIVWAPQEGKDGTYEHHENVAKLSPGDRIFHYKDKAIRAVGIVTGEPETTESSPDDGQDRWNEQGYQAPVEYHPLDEPIGRDTIPLEWRQEEGAPFTSAGELRQGYLYGLSEEFAKKLAGHFPQIGEHFPPVKPPPSPPGSVTPTLDLAAVCTDFAVKLEDAGLTFGVRHEAFVRDFVVSLATKQLVILTGLSGSGKTQIALQFGRWLGEDRWKVVPVRPDWTGAEALFGYPDALQKTKDGRRAWHVPDSLAFMLRAARDPDRPYLMVLDEMNLAHVERYFADVISGMESGEGCLPNVTREGGVWRESAKGPAKLPFPENLFVAGTVNVDETTYMFSPKVLDRANTMEFRVRTEDLSADLRKPGKCEAGDPSLVRGFLEIARDEDYHRKHPPGREDEYFGALEDLHGALDQAFAFGHRVVYEAVRFAALHEEAGGDSMEAALDTQVLQKILPRLHGSRRQLEPVLETVGKFCFDLEPAEAGNPTGSFDPVEPPDEDPVLPRSFDKVQRMTERLRTNQFVSFTE